MKTDSRLVTSFVNDECAATAIEYALIATVVAMALFTAIGFVGTGAGNLFNSVSDTATNSLNNSSSLMN